MSCYGPNAKAGCYTFHPDYSSKPITEKFWARHDSITNARTPQVIRYEDNIERIRKYDARCHSKMPRYANQAYGWLPGYKIRFLQNYDLNMHNDPGLQKIAKELMQQHFKGPNVN